MKTKNKDIIQYEEVLAKQEDGSHILVKIEKPTQITPEQQAEGVKQQLIKMGLEPIQQVKVEDPITGETRIISLDRTGHTEANLITTLADPNLTRDRKDHAISMYLYERGAHNTSMIVDLRRYKGAHTKETRVFKSQIRFDFEMFAQSFTRYLENQSRLLGITLDVDIQKERRDFAQWLALENNKGRGSTYVDYVCSKYDAGDISKSARAHYALIEMAIQSLEEAEHLRDGVARMTQAREKEKGKGIYIDRNGVPYDADDAALDDAVKADREATAGINNESR